VRRRFALALAASLTAGPLVADDAEPRPSLDEAMRGATAIAALGNGYLFIAQEDAAWVCAVNVNSNHFAAMIAGDRVVVEQTVPGTLCVPATHFKNLVE